MKGSIKRIKIQTTDQRKLFVTRVLLSRCFPAWVSAAARPSLVAVSRGCSSSRCPGFSLQRLPCGGVRLQANGLQYLQPAGPGAVMHARAYLLRSARDLRPGIEPMSPALAGRILSTVPPGKSHKSYSDKGIVFRIYQELSNVSNRETKNPVKLDKELRKKTNLPPKMVNKP